ncbi:MAG: hypothetical protein HKO56_08410, partial [Bacteroidia bacterium]|nr:hypothetical protein [Bacteroidia bacterium]
PFAAANVDGNSAFSNGMLFTVDNPAGILLNSIDVYPGLNTTIGVSLMTFQIKDSIGTTVYMTVNDTVNTFPGGPQTITFDLFLPQGTYSVHNTGVTNLFRNVLPQPFPFTVPGEITIVDGWLDPPLISFSTYYWFYNWQFTGGCPSAITEVCVDVIQPELAILSTDTSYCETGSLTLTGSSTTTAFTNYNWSPATGLSATTGVSVVASPTETTTYTLTADDGDPINGCTQTAEFTVYVFNNPVVSIDPLELDTVCINTPVEVNVVASRNEKASIGDLFDANSITTAVYNGGNTSVRTQMLITAAELNAAGITGGNLTCIEFNVAAKNSNTYYQDFSISLAQTASTSVTTTYTGTGLVEVFNDSIQTNLGWNAYTFDNEFNYDGTSNLLVDICYDNGGATPGGFDQVFASPTSFTSTIEPAFLGCSPPFGTTTNLRPNMRICGGDVTYAWDPSGDISSLTSATPTITPSTYGSNTYVITVLDPLSGCSASDSITIFADTIPLTPTASIIGDQFFCNEGESELIMTGSTGDIQWEMSTDGGATWTPIAGADSAYYATGIITQTTQYRVVITCVGTATSNAVTISVENPAILTTITDTICGNGSVRLEATGTGPVIAWFDNADDTEPSAYGTVYQPQVTGTDTFYVQSCADTSIAYGGGSGGSGGDVFNVGGTFGATNGSTPNSFNVINTSGSDLEITTIYWEWDAGASDIDILINPNGATSGNVTSAADWFVYETITGVTANGPGTGTPTTFAVPLVIPAGATFGISYSGTMTNSYQTGTGVPFVT